MKRKRVKFNMKDREVRQMVEGMKSEIAREFGLQVPPDGYWGHYKSKDLGALGWQLQKRLPVLLEWKKHNRARRDLQPDEGDDFSPSL